MDLFARAATKDRRGQPLAERMRPRRLSEVLGQAKLLGPGTWLRRAIEGKRLTSVILWGPPGTGKTTLGRIFAAEIDADFAAVSAVLSGVKELREEIALAEARLRERNVRTLLFVDEIHRFNKAQQDALLPHVESGTVILVGATTENPSFEVNAALLSRARVLVLEPLSAEDLRKILDEALTDAERGLGQEKLDCPPEVRDLIAREARGDARRALATLEAAAAVPVPDAEGVKHIDHATVEQALARRALLYDKAGDEHYGVVSAFIKSMRGTDPDAAVYWMARMLEAGEDPIFVLRRMVIFAAEDVGNADPRALSVAVSALDAFRLVGLPEGVLPMTQAVLYLASAPKSNTALATYAAAKADVDAHGALPVPPRLRNAVTPLGRSMGFGAGYQYPHDFTGHYVAEEYLPEALSGRRYYEPTESGDERAIKERLAALRPPSGGKRR
ncbi:MAG TPA: replication-associated recombination protein A [Polyangia bacterium]